MSTWQRQLNDLIDPVVERSASIDRVAIEAGLVSRMPELLDALPISNGILAITDDNTMKAAGNVVVAALTNVGLNVETLVFPGAPRLKPSTDVSRRIAEALKSNDLVPLAVGSGVINDVVKHAAKLTDRAYACFATAASMDGYTSAGAPLSDRGFKNTIQCTPARVIVADLDVITSAPREMTGWGYADLAGKLPAGADWILADALGIEPIDAKVWPMVQSPLRGWLSQPQLIANGDPEATAGLFAGLLMSGLAMEVYGSSRPASGADHQIAHLWEMEGLAFAGQTVSHGACVALGTLTVLSLYEALLSRDADTIDIPTRLEVWPAFDAVADDIRAVFPDSTVAVRAKYIGPDALGARLSDLKSVWPDLTKRLKSFLPPMDEMRAMLDTAGVITHPGQVGVPPDRHRQTVLASRYLRRRYTILDLLAEAGWLDDTVDALFSPPSLWAPGRVAAASG
jgi:glycerol-1-phosphate dehydrogenase [NAD(P)+]